MAAQGGAEAGANVQHDEFMEEDDPDGGSGDEGDAARAREPEPIQEEWRHAPQPDIAPCSEATQMAALSKG